LKSVPSAKGHGFTGDFKRLQLSHAQEIAGYNLLVQQPVWLGFSDFPTNLLWGDIDPDPANKVFGRIPGSVTFDISFSGLQLASDCFELRNYWPHPLN
jgi:hypothetical protein